LLDERIRNSFHDRSARKIPIVGDDRNGSQDMPLPHPLHTARLLLRPWTPDDAASLHPILVANWTHLSPWIPARVADPATVPELVVRLAGYAEDFTSDRAWRYAVIALDDRRILGELALFPRDAAARVELARADRVEVGYWLRSDDTGRGFVTEAVAAALDVARGVDRFERAEIHCDPRNAASRAVPRRLGFALAGAAAAAASPLEVWTSALRP
jgi:RimJ/RimL family protein N-acetyltransferase